MLFQYIGPDAEAPVTCEIYDLFFTLNGEPVEVTNAHTIKKLIGNPSFKFEPALMAPAAEIVRLTGLDEGDDVAEVVPTKPTIATVHSKKHSRR